MLLGVASLATSSPADAARRPGEPVVSGRLVGGPVLAGGLAAWTEDRGNGLETVRTGARGTRSRTVYRFRSDRGGLFDLAASRLGLTFTAVRFTDPGPQRTLLAGPRRGPFAARGGCESPGAALDGGRLFSLDQPFLCSPPRPGGSSAVIEELSGSRQTVPLGVQANAPLAIAGRYLAFGGFRSGEPVTVFDWVARTVVYRIPTPADGFPHIDLQSDGKAVASVVTPGQGARFPVDWYSPSEPHAHRIAVDAVRPEVRIGRDLVGFLRRGRGGVLELVYARLSGRRTPVARFRRRGRLRTALVGSFDFDGVRMTYGVRRRGRGTKTKIRVVRTPAARGSSPSWQPWR